MLYLKDVGFVIKRTNIGEADKYITVFTQHHGKIELVAKGVRRITSKRSSHIELLNLINFQSVKSKKNYVLTEVQLEDSFEHLKKDLSKVTAIFLICELVDKLCVVNQKHEDIFELLGEVIGDIGNHDMGESLFQFQVKLLTCLGFWDEKKRFSDEKDLRQFIEGIIERKVKTKLYFDV